MAETVVDPLETVEVEHDGRVLAGAGADVAELTATLTKQPAPEPPADEKPTKGQKRYSQLTKERDTALTEAQQAQALADELRNRLTLLEAKEAERAQQETASPPEAPAPQWTRPKPVVTEIGAKYPDYESFMEDLADWKAEQREIKLKQEFDARFEQRIEAERASVRQREASQSVLDRGRAAYQDFDAVVGGCQQVFPPGMLEEISKMPNAEHIEYTLGSDPAFAAEVAACRTGLELGLKLAERVPTGRRVPPASRPPAVRPSQAPPPYEPVAGASSTSAPPLADLAEAGNYEAYKAQRASQLKAAGGVTAHR